MVLMVMVWCDVVWLWLWLRCCGGCVVMVVFWFLSKLHYTHTACSFYSASYVVFVNSLRKLSSLLSGYPASSPFAFLFPFACPFPFSFCYFLQNHYNVCNFSPCPVGAFPCPATTWEPRTNQEAELSAG